MSYKIIRHYMDEAGPLACNSEVIKTGLTLEEAQAHCRDPETSSSTCVKPENKARTEEYGPWLEGYEEE